MKLIEVLSEDNRPEFYSPEAIAAANEIAEELVRECSQYFKEAKGLQMGKPEGLLRGVTFKSPSQRDMPVFTKQIRTNRKPLNTSEWIHKGFDEAFEDQFGFKWRSGSLFCTGSVGHARSFGSVRLIFPKGKFEYLWSPHIEDLTEDYDRSDKPEEWEFVRDAEYQTDNLKAAIKSGNEIMIRGDEYYVVDTLKWKNVIWPRVKQLI